MYCSQQSPLTTQSQSREILFTPKVFPSECLCLGIPSNHDHSQNLSKRITGMAILPKKVSFEPTHKIMVLFVCHKLILQMSMHSQWGYMSEFWSDSSSTSILHVCEQRRLWRECAGSPEPWLVAYVISTIISWTGSFKVFLAQLGASLTANQGVTGLSPGPATFFHSDLVMKTFLWPFSPFHWFKKGSCQLLAKEWALSTGKLPRRLAQEQCG